MYFQKPLNSNSLVSLFMFLRKFVTWLLKNLIVLLIITFIFSYVALDIPKVIKGVFSDIFAYSTPEAQKDVVGKLTSACSALDGKDTSSLQQDMSKGEVPFDLAKIGPICADYKSNKINDKEFFFSVIGTAMPEKFELPKTGAFEKYSSIIDLLTKNRMIYFLVLAVLMILLYLLVMDISIFILTLAGICFSMGIIILLPYAGIMAYEKFIGISTTSILSSLFQGSFSFDPKAIISVVLLMILRTYTSLIIMLGVIFLFLGIAGKIYSWQLKRKPKQEQDKKPEDQPEKQSKKENRKNKKDEDKYDESSMHQDRSTKDILDELDDIHKNKLKEKESKE